MSRISVSHRYDPRDTMLIRGTEGVRTYAAYRSMCFGRLREPRVCEDPSRALPSNLPHASGWGSTTPRTRPRGGRANAQRRQAGLRRT
jgi:hypothetical protein